MISRRRRALLTTALIRLLVPAAGVDAQGANTSLPGPESGALLRERGALPGHASTALVVAVSSSELTLVKVPVPDEIHTGDAVGFTITPLLNGGVVGSLSGSLGAGPAPRAVVFALRAPRRLAAGPIEAARVHFTGASRSVEVSVIANVATVRGITISFTSRLIAASAGVPVRIGYRLTNTGNAPDTVTVNAVLPPGWRILDVPAPIPLGMRESVDRVITVLPPQAQGVTTMRLVVLSAGVPVAESSLDIQVAMRAVSASPTSGPILRAGIAAALGPWEGASMTESLELHGYIADGLTIRARASSTPDNDYANYALSRAGLGAMPFTMQLAAPNWRLDAGTLGASVSDLTGVNLVGRGASLHVTNPGWSATGVYATPDLGVLDATGSLAASRLEITPGMLSVWAAGSRLRETRGVSTRSLDALSLGLGARELLGGRWGAEFAQRRFDGGVAPGWSGSYTRRTPDETFDIRYVHAPGGTRGFARALNEFAVNANRRVTDRLHFTGGIWRSEDEGGESLNTLTMDGWTLGGSYATSDRLQFSVTAHQNGFGAATSLGEFGSAEHGIDVTVEARRGGYTAQLTANGANIERRTTLRDSTTTLITQRAPRAGGRALFSYGIADVNLGVTGQYEHTGPGVGAAPIQWSYGARLDARPRFGAAQPVRVDGSIDRLGGSFGAARSLMVRAGAEVELPFRIAVRLGAERNPYVMPDKGTDWTYVVGVSRAVTLPRPHRQGTRGIVYRDVNGNGRRESGEPGFAGVMLRRGANLAVTDNRGAFVLMGNERDTYELDARSLPIGWIASSLVVSAETRVIGALSVAPLEVELALDAADTARVSTRHLADVVVTVQDSTGREWVARRVSDTKVVFDAIPPGTYAVIVDASAVAEPLRPTGELRGIVVATGRATAPVKVVMRARGLRFSNQRRGTP